MNYLSPIDSRPASPILIPQTEVIWHAPREFRNFMSTRRINLVGVLNDFVTGWPGSLRNLRLAHEFREMFERVSSMHLARVESLKSVETDPVSLTMPTELWELTAEAAEVVGKSCQELLLLLAAREIATCDELAEAVAQMRAVAARELAEATPHAGRILAGPWRKIN